MATKQENNRAKLYAALKQTISKKGSGWFSNEGSPILDEGMGLQEFVNTYFSSQKNFEKMYNDFTKVVTDKNTLVIDPSTQNLEFFYNKFACDLKWAAGVESCVNATKTEETKNSFPGCVQSIGSPKIASNGGAYIDGTDEKYRSLRFFNNGVVTNIATKTKGTYSCDEQNNVVIEMDQALPPTQPTDSTTQQPVQQTPAQQTPAQSQNPNRPKLTFHQCQGTYTPGCINTGSIASVQRCLDLTTNRHPDGSGYYDYILHDKLSTMGFRTGFTDADVSKICQMDTAKFRTGETQESDTPGQSTEPTESPRQTYEKYYAKLDGKETNRVKLKVNNLPDSDLKNLNEYLVTQGLYKIKNPKRRYGTKFVWGKKPS